MIDTRIRVTWQLPRKVDAPVVMESGYVVDFKVIDYHIEAVIVTDTGNIERRMIDNLQVVE